MKNGLSNEQVEESRRLHGSNKLPEPKQKKWYHFAKEALTEPITLILIIKKKLSTLKSKKVYSGRRFYINRKFKI